MTDQIADRDHKIKQNQIITDNEYKANALKYNIR